MRNQLHAVGGVAITPAETALLKAYRAMNSDGQNDALCIMEALVEPYRRPRPALTLVRGKVEAHLKGGGNATS